MHRSTVDVAVKLVVGSARGKQCAVAIDQDERVEFAVARIDSLERGACQLLRRQLTRPERAAELGERAIGEGHRASGVHPRAIGPAHLALAP